ncbi:MAG: tetratricopeptide repeat protein [Fibrobacterota bacterium]
MKSLRWLLPVFALALLTGCASAPPAVPEGDVVLPEIDIMSVKENSDEALKMSQEVKLDMEVLNSRLTDINNQLLNFSEEMASVSAAKIEELENRTAILTEEVKNIYHELDSLRKKVNVPQRKAAPAVFEMSTFGPGKDTQDAILSPDERKYRQAQSFFNAAQYLNAVVAFKDALKSAPNGKFADNCQFWIGESYFKLGQYAYAVAGYKKVFSYAQTDKADDAQMRIAVCYSRLGDNEQAVVEFKNLLQNYPQSEYADEARKSLKQLE